MMKFTRKKKVVLGDEYDEALWDDLRAVLRQLGANVHGESYDLGGSQEIESFELSVSGSRIVIESETYVGISVKGPPKLVDEIAALIRNLQKSVRGE